MKTQICIFSSNKTPINEQESGRF